MGDESDKAADALAAARQRPPRTEEYSVSFGDSEDHTGLEDTLLRIPAYVPAEAPGSDEFPPVEGGHYELGHEFARGGLGRILEAWDRRLSRTVAIKELLSRDDHAEARFYREAMITARLEHPNIVPIHEAGQWGNGDRFYAMKLVRGRTLSEKLELAGTDEERLALVPAVVDVCDAIAYAHSQGILHRDLKPSNVMLGPFGETVVIDWGLAKDIRDSDELDTFSEDAGRVAESVFDTADGIVVGTPPYMPPEQAAARPLDPRSDVYSLGAILYHVLTGFRPYENIEAHKILQAVVDVAPTPLLTLSPGMPKDLVAIVNKAMARDPADRYASAQQMAEELRRLLTGQLVAAHEYSAFEIFRRFFERQKAAVVTATLAIAVLIAFGAWSFENIRVERNQASANADIAEARLDRYRLERARAALAEDPTDALVQLTQIQDLSNVSPGAASLAAEALDRGVARHVLEGHTGVVNVVAVSRDGRWVASASQDHSVRVWDTETGAERRLNGHTDNVTSLALSHSGRLASGSHDHTVRVWDLNKKGSNQVLEGHEGPVRHVSFSEDGLRLASSSEDRTVRVWDLGTEQAEVLYVDEADRNVAAYFLPGGKFLLSGGHGEGAVVWDLQGGTRQVLRGYDGEVKAVACAPIGLKVAVADAGGRITVHDLDAGTVRRFVAHEEVATTMVFSPDARKLASAGMDRVIWLWDMQTDAHRSFVGHEERISQLVFTPDSMRLLSSSWDRTVRVWDLQFGVDKVLRGHQAAVSSVALSADGRTIASGAWDKTVRVWNLAPAQSKVLVGHSIGVHGLDFSPNAEQIASGGHDNQLRIWDLESGTSRVFEGHEDHIYRVFYSPDGRYVASSSDDMTVRLWNVKDGSSRVLRGHTADVEELSFSPDGSKLASAAEDNLVRLWDVDGTGSRALKGHEGHVTAVAFSPNGKLLVSSSRDHTVRVWPVLGTGTRVLRGHEDIVWSVAVAPDGQEIVSASADGTVRTFDLETGKALATFDVAQARIVRYSPDGRFFAVATLGPEVWLCLRSHSLCDRLVGHSAMTRDLAFTPDSRGLVTGSADHTVRIWDVETRESRVLRGHEAGVFDVSVSKDGLWVASASADTTVRVWPVVLPPSPEDLMQWVGSQTSYLGRRDQ